MKDKKLPKGEIFYREVSVASADVNAETRTVNLAFSSEEPVERWYGREILDHNPKSVRMNRLGDGAPFLLQHNPDDQIGVVQLARIDSDKVGRATVKLSKSVRGQEILQDILDGIRTKVSVGYIPHEMTLETKSDDIETYRIGDWEPIEISLVSIPADTTVGVGRELTKTNNREAAMSEVTNPAPSNQKDSATLEAERVSEIKDIGKRFGDRVKGGKDAMGKLVEDAIELKVSAEQFRGDVYLRVNDSKPIETPESLLDLSANDKKRFSLSRALDAMARREFAKYAPFEAECSQAIADRTKAPPKGFYIPYDIMTSNASQMQRFANATATRDLTVGSATAGGNLVGTNLLAASFIELLRNRSVAIQVGVQTLSGLVGNVAIPTQTGAGTFSWVAENSAPSETALTVGQVTMSPKTGSAYMDYSRQLLLQSTPSIDLLVQNDLLRIAALGVDAAVFLGSGSGNQPTGIITTSGIGSVTAAAAGWAQVVEFETDVAAANADAGTMYYVMNASARGLFKTRLKAVNTGIFLMESGNTMNGYPVAVSNQITSGRVIFGDFSQALLGEWGTVDVLSDPYTGSSAGTTRVTIFVSVDVAVRHAASFSACTDLS